MKGKVRNKTSEKTARAAMEIWVIRDASRKSTGIDRSISLAFAFDREAAAEAAGEGEEKELASMNVPGNPEDIHGEKARLILF